MWNAKSDYWPLAFACVLSNSLGHAARFCGKRAEPRGPRPTQSTVQRATTVFDKRANGESSSEPFKNPNTRNFPTAFRVAFRPNFDLPQRLLISTPLRDVRYANSYSCIYIHTSEERQENINEKNVSTRFSGKLCSFGLLWPIGCGDGDLAHHFKVVEDSLNGKV